MTPRAFAIEITKALQAAGFEALWAGGCVRDALLGQQPKDYDVATNASPDQVRELFGHQRTIPIGAAFGVITVLGPKSAGQIEVATFRNDGVYSDGRHPDSIQFSTAREDAQRRDFTINGLFFDPISDRVIDYVDGQVDLKNRIVRAIGDPRKRIEEDKLRMLRAVRFASTFDFELDPETAAAIRDESAKLSVVSRERISAELRRMLAHSNRRSAMVWLKELQLIDVIVERRFFPDDWPNRKTLATLEEIRSDQFVVSLAALLIDFVGDTKQLAKMLRDWKLSSEEIKTTRWLMEVETPLRKATELPWPQIQRILIHQDIGQALELAKAMSAIQEKELRIAEEQSLQYCDQKLSLAPAELNPAPLITGDDLMAAGFAPGPRFKSTLTAIRDAQLMGQLETQSEALKRAAELLNGSDEI